jgi:hypothetical protein
MRKSGFSSKGTAMLFFTSVRKKLSYQALTRRGS